MSPTEVAGSVAIPFRMRINRAANSRTVDSSNRSVAYVNVADSPSDTSLIVSCRSNLATVSSIANSAAVRPGRANEFCPRFWNANATWNSGWCALDRTGSSTSTSRSKGRSECANA
ncbi:hypothetical protein B0E55_02914 [Rhodococcus sp. 66b]|nr:hypothetical protein B0E55_02914 [Rhodococcus sp. 66b]